MSKELRKIDKGTKYCLYGWIRELKMNLHIPSMIEVYCIIYVNKVDNHYFCPHGNKLRKKSVKARMKPKRRLATNTYTSYTLQCDGCGCKYTLNNIDCEKEILHCNCCKCKRNGGYDRCYPSCV